MTIISVVVPEALGVQKAELEASLAEIAHAEGRLAAQRSEIQTALHTINTGIAVLSGQRPLPDSKPISGGRRPMSAEARRKISEALRKSAALKAEAKAAQIAVVAPQMPTEEPVLAPPKEPVQKAVPARRRARNR